jgi:type I restriction enzyme M protein
MANPPFNLSDWGQEKLLNDYRWKYGTPPKGNANYAWIEHMVSKLSQDGKAAIILANGSLSAGGQEPEILPLDILFPLC